MFGIKIPQGRFGGLVTDLWGNQGRVGIFTAGMCSSSTSGPVQYLFHDFAGFPRKPVETGPGLHPVAVMHVHSIDDRAAAHFMKAARSLQAAAGLLIVSDGEEMSARYFSQASESPGEPGCLSLPGPRMERLLMHPLPGPAGSGPPPGDGRSLMRPDYGLIERMDRFAGFLGQGNVREGMKHEERAMDLKVVIAGAGGSGYQIATTAAMQCIGERGELYMIDNDTVELSNLSRMFLPRESVGMPKAEALCAFIKAVVPESRPVAVNTVLGSREAVEIIKTSDVLFGCVDNDEIRAGLAVLAVRYHLLLIDMAGGSAMHGGKAVEGGDVRVFVPGSLGGPCCMGSHDWKRAEAAAGMSREEERARRSSAQWDDGTRNGSAAHVLMQVAGDAISVFWKVMRGSIRASGWRHLDCTGFPEWALRMDGRKSRGCTVCRSQAGTGDLPEKGVQAWKGTTSGIT